MTTLYFYVTIINASNIMICFQVAEPAKPFSPNYHNLCYLAIQFLFSFPQAEISDWARFVPERRQNWIKLDKPENFENIFDSIYWLDEPKRTD